MVKEGDRVVVVPVERTRAEQEALVLGVDGEYVWLYSTGALEVYRSNPACILEHEGRKILFKYDDCRSMDDVFGADGECDSSVFWHASETARVRLTKLLKTWKLISP